MKPLHPRHIVLLAIVGLLLLLVGCSTQKNTAKTRRWHSFKAKYNIMYNGTQAYIDGSMEKEKGNKDNFTEIIPLYAVGNKSSQEIGKGNFEKAIEKSQKAIKLHSIKRKPEWNKRRRKTEKDIEWLSRREYNPYLWKSWMLMGRSQFHKGAFDEAASTFSYMSRLYQSQPSIYGRARAWLAKCYIEQDWLYDAEDVIRNMARDSIHWRAQKEWDYTYADYYIHLGDYEQAIPYLKKVIKHEMRKVQKAREWYLLGQLYSALGKKDLAYKAYKHVPRLSPPYEIAFNAHIAMTEVMAGSQAKKMISKLKRMAASDNNKDYLDQVYYAIGNIYMAEKDTIHAISAYERGNKKSTRNGIEKGVLLLRLGDIYWEREKYNDAQRCYGEAIGLLDKERKDYEQLSHRSKVLDELVPYTDAVYLQDSLQVLAKMNEKDRNAAIDRVIDALKKKEKEERDRQAELEAEKNGNNNSAFGNNNNNAAQNAQQANQQQNGLWYFYNQMAVSQGKASFQKLWGKRENEDNWQRSNKTVVAAGFDEEYTEEQLDSIAQQEALQDSLEQVTDSAQFDPHKREYYLAQIPFTEEQVEASNLIIKEGLYQSGVIFKDKLDNLILSRKAFTRLAEQYPDYEGMENAYYHMFLLYSRLGEPAIANTYVEKLKNEYPTSNWTTILTDPYFAENSRFGVHIEDSLYASTYDAFKADRHHEVDINTQLSQERFPLGANRDKFIFIGGLSKLNAGDADACLKDMQTLVESYPQSKLSEMAGMIINGVKAGRQLRGGRFDIGDVWNRRAIVLNDSDSIAARTLSNERNSEFMFVIAYMPDSVNENQILYQLAKYNFTSYMVRNFDIEIEDLDGIHLMQVSGFRNYDEALQYARQFHKQVNISRLLEGCRTIIISKENKELLGRNVSFDEYDDYYNKHFAPLKISTLELLQEPSEVATEPEKKPTVEQIDEMLDQNIFDNGLDVGGQEEELLIPEEEDNATETAEDDNLIVPEEEQEGTDNADTLIIEEEQPAENGATETTVIADETAVQPEQQDDEVVISDVNDADNTIVQPEETTIEAEEDGLIIQPEEPIKVEQSGIVVQPNEVVVEDEEPIRVEQPSIVVQPNEVVVEDEEPIRVEQPGAMVQTNEVVVEDEEPIRVEQPDAMVQPNAQPTSNTQPQQTRQPVNQTEEKPATNEVRNAPQEDEDAIYFEEDDVPAPTTPTTNANKQAAPQKKAEPVNDDIDDEYYDFDGF